MREEGDGAMGAHENTQSQFVNTHTRRGRERKAQNNTTYINKRPYKIGDVPSWGKCKARG